MFHVPESARVPDGVLASTRADGCNGAFDVASPEPGWRLAIIAGDGCGWEHVSVHAYRRRGRTTQARILGAVGVVQGRVPIWREMAFVKDLFWDAEDLVIQIHPPRSEYVNQHPHVLHLWRPIGQDVPRPTPDLVGYRVWTGGDERLGP